MNTCFAVCYLSLAWKCKHWHTYRFMLSCDPMRACRVLCRRGCRDVAFVVAFHCGASKQYVAYHFSCGQCIVNMLHGFSSLVLAGDVATPPRCHASSFTNNDPTGARVTEAVGPKHFGSIHGSSVGVWRTTSKAAASHKQADSRCGLAEASRFVKAVACD